MMAFTQRQKLALFLMASSLGLLLVFLGFFLQRVYQDELETLQKETNLLFINAVQGIEGDILQEILIQLAPDRKADSLPDNVMPLTASKSPDSLKIMTFLSDRVLKTGSDSISRVRIQVASPRRDSSAGKVALFMNMDKTMHFDTRLNPDTIGMSLRIREAFAKAMRAADIAVEYKMYNETTMDSSTHSGSSYTHFSSGNRIGMELLDTGGYIWKKMWMEVLFSGLLFMLVGLAFGFIFQTMIQQQRLAEQKNDFIRNMTHELKTPIATVSVAVEALQNFDALQNPARTREYLDITRHELSRLSLLVDKVLRMSLFEKNEPELKLESIDFKGLVEEILVTMKLQFEKYGAQVGFISQGEHFTLRGDRIHLAGVVYNLIDNALKYGGQHPRIGLQLQAEAHQVVLEVQDSGQGIPANFREKVFEKFFRVPTGNTHNVKGHGLGLSYVAGVVRQHQGSIGVTNKEGSGALFTVTLPIQ